MLKKNEQYKIVDNFLSVKEYQDTWNFIQNADYKVGGTEHENGVPVGMTSELAIHANPFFPKQVNGIPLYRINVNYYGPRETTVFHYDNNDPEAITLVYFPCPTYGLDEGGHVELVIDKEIVGVRSVTNRLLAYKSNILHRATPFNTHQRFTLALKYSRNPEDTQRQ